MNYLEEQTDGEAMINSIKNGDQPLPRVTQVSIAGTSHTEQPPLKYKSMCIGYWANKSEQKKRESCSSSESEGSDDELKKITALLAKAFNRKKFYSKPTNNNLRTSSATSSANKKQEYVKSDDKKEEKKVDEKKRDMSNVKCNNYKKEGNFAKDCKKAKVKDYEYYKTKMLLVKKDKDEQVLLTNDHAWMESSSDSNQEINENMVFMAQIEKVLSDSEASSLSSDDKIAKIADQEILFDKMSHQLVEFDENTVLEKDLKISELEECVRNKKQSKSDCQEIEKECDNLEISNVIALGMFKLSVSQSVSPIFVTKTSCASNSVENLDSLSSVRRPMPNGVMWMKKGSSNTVKANLDTRSVHACNNARNSYYNSYDVDVNDLFVFDDIVQICQYMTVNRVVLTNFIEKFLGTVRFGNNDFAVIAGYGDVVIRSMTIKKVYYVEDVIFSMTMMMLESSRKKGILECLLDNLKNQLHSEFITNELKLQRKIHEIHESVNVDFDEISEMASRKFSLELDLSNLNEMRKSSNPLVSQVSETSKNDLEDLFHNFYNEYFDSSKIMKSSTMNVETSNVKIPSQEEEVFHESFESFQEESSSSSLNDDV
nr:integrase, catalytic region, zinc finger, CCHC-type, peptidase aspartic, catalytic [Tanacetum cinerariifolium]